MNILKFVITSILSALLLYSLSISINGIPPLGLFFSPHHGYLQNGETQKINIPNELKLKGIKEKVVIQFDDLLIPHIYAQNEEDLFYAQGYITAHHRLFQMDIQAHKTAGRLSELFGDKFLNFDRKQRRKGLVKGAENALEELSKNPEYLKKVEAYVNGVNTYIDELLLKNYPIEYKILGANPEKWTALKVCLLTKEMADQLSRGEADLEYTNALKLWGRETLDILYPDEFANIDPVIPSGTKFKFNPIKVEKPDVTFPLLFTKGNLEKPNVNNGSNSFAVNEKLTHDACVFLANEPDLALKLPSIWYVAHLNCPTLNVMGASIPGSPYIIIGFNDSIAWGNTNAKRDLVDWYYIEFKNNKRDEYLVDNKWIKTKIKVEEFKIKGKDSFFDTIVYTHYGPVYYDKNFKLNEDTTLNLAIKWTAHNNSNEFITFDLLNRANNYDDFIEAYSYFTGPPQNVSFASSSGDIAIQISGKFPVKWKEQGKFIMDGRDSRFDWKKMMPYEHLYKVKNPKSNFISSANQNPGDSLYPYYDFDYHWEFYRNRRINDRLRTMSNIKEEDLMKLQNDNFNYSAYESLPLMIDNIDSLLIDTEKKKEYLSILKSWDFFNDPEKNAPVLYDIWWDILYNLLWDEFDNKKVSLHKPFKYNTIHIFNTQKDFAFYDIINTEKKETLQDLIQFSFEKMVDSVSNLVAQNKNTIPKWYEYKNTTISHLLNIAPFSVSKVQIGGDDGIVNAATSTHGPSWRMIVKLDKYNGISAWGVYPGSQSGNPGNISYAHMVDDWAKGNYYKLIFDKSYLNDNELLFNLNINPQ